MPILTIVGDVRAVDANKVRLSPSLFQLINSADISVCNFEVPISLSGGKPIAKSGPSLSQDPLMVTRLKEFGFNLFSLANNHACDYGEFGLESTIQSIGIDYTVGAGNYNSAYALRLIEVEGKKIGFLAFTQKEFGTIAYGEEGYGTSWICDPHIPSLISDAKQKVDFLVLLPHAGLEEIDAPLPIWRNLYRYFVDCGADAVVASHPHAPQGWEQYRGKNILYSLGNFYFDGIKGGHYWNKGLLVRFVINDSVNLEVYNTIFHADGLIDLDQSDEIKEHNKLVCDLILDEKSYRNYIDRVCLAAYHGYRYGILRGVCGWTAWMKVKYSFRLLGAMLLKNKDEYYLLNAFQCETHRWVIEHALRLHTSNKK